RQAFPDNAAAGLEALFLLGQVLTEEKSFDEARHVYQQIASQRSNPAATEGLYFGGEAMYEAKRYADAVRYYKGVRSTAELLENLQRQIDTLSSQRAQFIAEHSLVAWQARVEALQQLQDRKSVV